MHGIVYPVLAGVFASLAAIASKVTFANYSWQNDPLPFLAFLSAALVSNVLMWLFFTKALARSTSTVKVMAINTGTNFALTGILGAAIWGETHSIVWWLGLSLVISGSALLLNEEDEKKRME
ncbi:unnamed protein product, partial [Mesorhabditis spiculigera]